MQFQLQLKSGCIIRPLAEETIHLHLICAGDRDQLCCRRQVPLRGARQLHQAAAASNAASAAASVRRFSQDALVLLWQPEELDPLQPKVDGGYHPKLMARCQGTVARLARLHITRNSCNMLFTTLVAPLIMGLPNVTNETLQSQAQTTGAPQEPSSRL